MKLRSGNDITVKDFPVNMIQDQASSGLRLNEKMMRFVANINSEKDKAKKLQYILDFYLFLKNSMDDIMVPKYHKLIAAIVEKTQVHMNTLEDEYFSEMSTKKQQNHMFECYYTLSTVRRSYKKYLHSLCLAPLPSMATLAPTEVAPPELLPLTG